MEWFVLIINLFIPLLQLFAGWMMLYHPPKNINSFYGYRTTRSMRNLDTWNFAHRICGKLWMQMGAILFVVSTIVSFVFWGAFWTNIPLMIGQVFCLFYSIVPVEKALKDKFGV
ncbi:MAG: SdpI family protein [Bacillota bacterium]|nr:SdpI family protein [Bacillota bacterium]